LADRAGSGYEVAASVSAKHWFSCRVLVLRAVLAVVVSFLSCLALHAEEAWIYSPYRMKVWFAVENQHSFTPFWRQQLDTVFQQQSWVIAGAPWNLRTDNAPPSIRASILRDLERITADELLASDEKLTDSDKLMLVRITSDPNGYSIAAREFDIRTRIFGPVIRFTSAQRELIATSAFRAVTLAFAPVGRIDDVHEEIVEKPGSEVKTRQSVAVVRFRAGGLVTEDSSPAAVRPEQAMIAVIRTNDRKGETHAEGLRIVEWTLLEVRTIKDGNAECRVHTANRAYLTGRASSRVERLALGLRITEPSTMLEVVTRDKKKEPLVGYYVYAKDPNTEDTELLGQTDWRGQVNVPPAKDGRVRLLYVRSGDSLLARLPMMPGQSKVERAELNDDQKRLQAEALVRGLQTSIRDLVARREITAARIRKRIKEGKIEEAQKLLEEFRALPTVADMRARIDQAKLLVIGEKDRGQEFIEKMFSDTLNLLNNIKIIDPKLVDNLTTELAAAKANPAASSSTDSGPATNPSTPAATPDTAAPPATDKAEPENPFESPEEKKGN